MTTKFENGCIVVEFSEEVCISEQWQLGKFLLKFVQLNANEEMRVTPQDYVKVIDGMLSDPLRLSMIGPFEKSSTVIVEDLIKAGKKSILMIISTSDAPEEIASVSELLLKGPFNDQLMWNQVGDLHWGNKFIGVEFYNLRGWDIRNANNKHMAFIQAWLAGSGVNCGNHNHSEMGDNTFRELHLCIRNGSGYGGMTWIKDDEEFTLPLLQGEEHGPFWEWSEDLTKVVYPVHRWQAGVSENNALDFWFAIELPPPKAAY